MRYCNINACSHLINPKRYILGRNTFMHSVTFNAWRDKMNNLQTGIILLALILISNMFLVNAEQVIQNETKLAIDKNIIGEPCYPQFTYTVTTPKVVDFDFVLAVDSSGSFGKSGDNSIQEDAIKDAIPKFLEKILEKSQQQNANFNIAIVSWNDKIDFAYYGFDNDDPSKAKLVPISTAVNDSDKFVENYICDEPDGTDFSSAIKASVNILDANPINKYHQYKRFIILLTGKSEFEKCSPEILEYAQDKYDIYVIGIDIPPEPSELRDHLNQIADYKDGRIQFISTGSPEISGSLEKSVEVATMSNESLRALIETVDNAMNSPVAYDVQLVESLYSYLNPDSDSFIVNGEKIKPLINRNSDNTNTITLDLPDLSPNSQTEVSFSAGLALWQLPASVTKNAKSSITIGAPNSNTPPSSFKYTWFDSVPYELDLPACELPAN